MSFHDWEVVDESAGVRLVREVAWIVETADAEGVWESLPYADEDAARAAFLEAVEHDA
jgi:hypothetical protein